MSNLKHFNFILAFLIIYTTSVSGSEVSEILNDQLLMKKYLKMQKFDIDTNAKAIILFEKHEADFTKYDQKINNRTNYDIELRVEKLIKVIDQDALSFADLNLPFSRVAKIKNLQARSYNLQNGVVTVQDVSKDEIITEKISGPYKQLKLNIPNGCFEL